MLEIVFERKLLRVGSTRIVTLVAENAVEAPLKPYLLRHFPIVRSLIGRGLAAATVVNIASFYSFVSQKNYNTSFFNKIYLKYNFSKNNAYQN